jgi:hypothetical protein
MAPDNGPTTKQRHTALYKGSDFYRQAFDTYGRSLNAETANRLCKMHGFTLDQLVEWGEIVIPTVSGRVPTLMLTEALGY